MIKEPKGTIQRVAIGRRSKIKYDYLNVKELKGNNIKWSERIETREWTPIMLGRNISRNIYIYIYIYIYIVRCVEFLRDMCDPTRRYSASDFVTIASCRSDK